MAPRRVHELGLGEPIDQAVRERNLELQLERINDSFIVQYFTESDSMRDIYIPTFLVACCTSHRSEEAEEE